MTDLLVLYFYFYVTVEALLILGAAIYSFRLMRLTGAFRAWVLMIAALSVLAFGVLASYVNIMLFDSSSQIDKLVHGPTPTMFVVGSAYGLTGSRIYHLYHHLQGEGKRFLCQQVYQPLTQA